jgi:hypothetical protein
MKRTFLLAATVTAALAQQPPVPPSAVADARRDWAFISSMLLRAAEGMPEDSYAFKPVATVRDFGQEVAHAATAQAGICGMITGTGAKIAASVNAAKTKAQLIQVLKESNVECDKAAEMLSGDGANQPAGLGPMAGRTRLGLFNYNTGHSQETYGTMVVYLRMKGLVPPTSAPNPAAK